MKVRRFRGGEVNHVYQRTIDRFNIFYSIADYIVYFTIFCTLARRYDITIWGLCLMRDHIHSLIQAEKKDILSRFMSHVSSVFVREYNSSLGRNGPLFDERFGSAPKIDKKRLISCIIYVGNNPVEKSLCRYAEEFRWNFLAYMASDCPFSEKYVARNASSRMRKALKMVERFHSNGLYLRYSIVNRLFEGLSAKEITQLTDLIVTKYNVIDYGSVMRYFESYDCLLQSMHSTTGTEYDIREDRNRFSDMVYRDLTDASTKLGFTDVRRLIVLTVDEKLKLARKLNMMTGASIPQIAKFLHLKIASDPEPCYTTY